MITNSEKEKGREERERERKKKERKKMVIGMINYKGFRLNAMTSE